MLGEIIVGLIGLSSILSLIFYENGMNDSDFRVSHRSYEEFEAENRRRWP